MAKETSDILAIDIGGTGLKAAIIDPSGQMQGERVRVATPHPCPPDLLVETLAELVAALPAYGRISVGFPGLVRHGRILTAPHLSPDGWAGFPLGQKLAARLGNKPIRLINDAEVQGLGLIKGKGIELALTLGTGAGTAVFRDGELMPHMELAHHPITRSKTYDDYIGEAAREKIGNKRWNKRLKHVIDVLFVLFHYDHLYLGGGNTKHVKLALPANVTLGSNDAGLDGGAALWRLKNFHESEEAPEISPRVEAPAKAKTKAKTGMTARTGTAAKASTPARAGASGRAKPAGKTALARKKAKA
ncbi:chromosome partitioning protein ParA [Labrys okinawensis]|uniref:Chromosome partitioning protein ParA n=1 Tax=Labrys okinawensis TaxID=346911 RepID=A0A2S9QEX3_9HYPH|nr:ROK family protein [Labrys okinawensis]PRH87865.1 chromosome partitioning protein ParA [Labrys okinawensis]